LRTTCAARLRSCTPKLERGLESSDNEELRAVTRQALAHIDKAMLTVAALLRLADVEYGPKSSQFRTIDLSAICTDSIVAYAVTGRPSSWVTDNPPCRSRG